MKTLTVILLSLVILVQPLSKLILVANYQVNKNYIAEFLCVNKSKPELQCNGKCHLSKELKATDDHEKNLPSSVKQQLEMLYFCEATPTFSFILPTVSKAVFRVYHLPEYAPPVISIHQPPKIAA